MSHCLSGVRPSEIASQSQTGTDLRRINPRAKRNGKSGSLTNAHASRTASTVKIAITELSTQPSQTIGSPCAESQVRPRT